MRTNSKCTFRICIHLGAMLTMVGACTPPDFGDQSMIDEACEEMSHEIPLPQSVPQELLIDASDPKAHPLITNSLNLVPIGTVLDDVAGLDGCWARQDVDDWGITKVAREVMRFDSSQESLTTYRLLEPTILSDDFFIHMFETDLPYFDKNVWAVTRLSDNKLELNLIEGEGAAINPDGTTAFYCAVAGGSWDNYLIAIVTLDGNSLKYGSSYEDIDPADAVNELEAEYWVRIECP